MSPLSNNSISPATVYLTRLSVGSQPTMRSALSKIVIFLGFPGDTIEGFEWHLLTPRDAKAVKDYFVSSYSPNGAAKSMSALRGCLEEAMNMGLMSADAFLGVCRHLSTPPAKPLSTGRLISKEQISLLFECCLQDNSLFGIRDAAVLAVLRIGLRRSEVSLLDIEQYSPKTRILEVNEQKTRSVRIAYLSTELARFVDRWTECLPDPFGVMFCRIRGTRLTNERLGDQGIGDIFDRRCKQCGIEGFTTHDFRHTFISELLSSGIELQATQSFIGHKLASSSIIYDQRTIDKSFERMVSMTDQILG